MIYLPILIWRGPLVDKVVISIPVTGASNGMAGGADLIADIYIFDKYGNFWTSKYIIRGDDGNS